MEGLGQKGTWEVVLSCGRGLLTCWDLWDWGKFREGLLFRPHVGKETKATEKETRAGPQPAAQVS